MMETNICTLNVRGLGAKLKRTQIFQWLKDNDYSICLLQETHSTIANKKEWETDWGREAFFSGNSK